MTSKKKKCVRRKDHPPPLPPGYRLADNKGKLKFIHTPLSCFFVTTRRSASEGRGVGGGEGGAVLGGTHLFSPIPFTPRRNFPRVP